MRHLAFAATERRSPDPARSKFQHLRAGLAHQPDRMRCQGRRAVRVRRQRPAIDAKRRGDQRIAEQRFQILQLAAADGEQRGTEGRQIGGAGRGA